MIRTNQAKLSDLSSLWKVMDKVDNLSGKVAELISGRDVDATSAPEAFLLYEANSNKMFKRDIMNLINEKKIVLKYNPLVAVGMYLPYAPLIDKSSGAVQVIVNATSYCTEEDGKFKINVNDLIGLCQGAWAIYKSLINYTKICANFQMRYLLIELYTKILTIGISGSSIFASGANAKYLKYICARFMLNHHFGIDKNVHESAMNQAKIENGTEKAFINQLVLETPKELWQSFHGLVEILKRNFTALKDKVSVEFIRQRVSIILGSPNVFSVDYVPYLCALASGYYNNYSVYRSSSIKTELQPYCIAVAREVLQSL